MPAHLLSLPLFTVECIDSASGACRRGLDWENPEVTRMVSWEIFVLAFFSIDAGRYTHLVLGMGPQQWWLSTLSIVL